MRRHNTQSLVDALNEVVIAEGGRVYLAKDALTRPEHFRAMEPRLDAFLAVRRKWIPSDEFEARNRCGSLDGETSRERRRSRRDEGNGTRPCAPNGGARRSPVSASARTRRTAAQRQGSAVAQHGSSRRRRGGLRIWNDSRRSTRRWIRRKPPSRSLDVVVVTAGQFATQDRLEQDPELAHRLLTVNFANTVTFCERARRRLLARGGGTLCAFSSVAGERGRKRVVYGAAKRG